MKSLLKGIFGCKLNVAMFIVATNLIMIHKTSAQIGVNTSYEVDYINLHNIVIDKIASNGVFEWSNKEKKYVLVFAKLSSKTFPDNPLFKNQSFGKIDVYSKFKKEETYESTYYFHGSYEAGSGGYNPDRLKYIKAYSNNGKVGFVGNEMKLEEWALGTKFTFDGWILAFRRPKIDSLTIRDMQVQMINELIDGLLKNITPNKQLSLHTVPGNKDLGSVRINGKFNSYAELLSKKEINVTAIGKDAGSVYNLMNSVRERVEEIGWNTIVHLPKLERINVYVSDRHFYVLEINKGNRRHVYSPRLMELPYTIKAQITDDAKNQERTYISEKLEYEKRKAMEAEEDKLYFVNRFKQRVINELNRGNSNRLKSSPALYKTLDFWGDLAVKFYIGDKVEVRHIEDLNDDSSIKRFLRWYCNFVYAYNGDFELIDRNILSELFNSYVHSYSVKCRSSLPTNYKTRVYNWTEDVTTGYTQNQVWWGNTLLNAGRDYHYDQVRKSREVYVHPRFYDAFVEYGDRSFTGPTQEMYFINYCGCKGAETLHLGENLLKAITSDTRVKITEKVLISISKQQDYSKLIDDLIYENSASWFLNQYKSGSISNVVVTRNSHGLPEVISANYNYSKVASVKLTFKEGLPECMYFHDFPSRCEVPSRKIVFSYSQGGYSVNDRN